MGATACLLQSLWQSCRGGCARVSGIFTADWKKKKFRSSILAKCKKVSTLIYIWCLVRSNKARFPVISFNDSKSDCEFCVFLFFLQSYFLLSYQTDMLIKKHCLSHCRSSLVSFSLPHCLNVYPSNLPLIPSSFLTFYVCLLPQPPFHSLSMVPTFPTLSLPCSSSCFSLLPPSFLFISMSISLVPVFTGFSSPLPSLSISPSLW